MDHLRTESIYARLWLARKGLKRCEPGTIAHEYFVQRTADLEAVLHEREMQGRW